MVLQAAATQGSEDTVRLDLAPLRYEVAQNQKVGEKRAGLLCLPNGSLRFGAFVLPDSEMISATLAKRLAGDGRSVVRPDEAWDDRGTPRYRVFPVITQLNLSGCAKRWGFGDTNRIKGFAQVSIRWTIYDKLQRANVGDFQSAGRYDSGSELSTPASLLDGAIGAAAAEAERSGAWRGLN